MPSRLHALHDGLRGRTAIATVLAAVTAIALVVHGFPAAATGQDSPRLLVILVVDQFRGDYAEMYGQQWSRGLRRLWDGGAVFTEAAYSFGRTTTCGGHATITTGTFPATHGVIDNSWFDRASGQSVYCTQDPSARPVSAGVAVSGAHGPAQLLAPTIGDALVLLSAGKSRVVAISPKVRSAVMLAGRGGPNTLAVWSENSGSWWTSSAYRSDRWPEVVDYVRAHPLAATYQTWTTLLAPSAYRFADDAPGEINPRVFPHPVRAPGEWSRSPASDTYVGDLAIALTDKLRLGQGDAIDVLALGFSALDVIGHDYGPHSHEVQDTLARLDVTIGRLLDALDRTVGPTRYVMALSSDHGVSALPEQAGLHGFTAGRVGAGDVRQATDKALAETFGPGNYVVGVYGTNVYFVPAVANRILSSGEARKAVTAALERLPAIERTYWRDDLLSTSPTNDAMLASLRRSYHPERSADLIVLPKPHWLLRADDADHGTPHQYDTHVPLVFYGTGIKAGRHSTAATPADLAPTLASIAGITLPRIDGQNLTGVVTR